MSVTGLFDDYAGFISQPNENRVYIAAVSWLQNDRERAVEFIQERAAHFREKYAKEGLFTDRDRIIEREAFINWLVAQTIDPRTEKESKRLRRD